MHPPPEQKDPDGGHANAQDPARAHGPGRAVPRGQISQGALPLDLAAAPLAARQCLLARFARGIARLPVISASQYNSRRSFRPFHDTPPRIVTLAGVWFFLAGLLFMITGDGPTATRHPGEMADAVFPPGVALAVSGVPGTRRRVHRRRRGREVMEASPPSPSSRRWLPCSAHSSRRSRQSFTG